jgi:lipoprotein-anchoring transpeptidase ErfK/SrfK
VPALLAVAVVAVTVFAAACAFYPLGRRLPPGPVTSGATEQDRGFAVSGVSAPLAIPGPAHPTPSSPSSASRPTPRTPGAGRSGASSGPGRSGAARSGAARSEVAATPTAVGRVARPAPLATSGWIAVLRGALAYSSRPGGPTGGVLPALDPFGIATVLGVVGAPQADGWAEVELPVRPDGSVGWIRWSEVTLRHTSYRIVVDLDARTLTLYNAATTVLSTPVAVGAPATPTPVASTYVWELVRPDDPTGPYGPYILGLALFSDAYAVFNGGDAQIGIHGNDEPDSIGEAASHGCVRVANPLAVRLASVVPLGTPVTIRA